MPYDSTNSLYIFHHSLINYSSISFLLQPTSIPTSSPSATPTFAPSDYPTNNPSSHPTLVPSFSPSKAPTDEPTSGPTFVPSDYPTNNPSSHPTLIPSFSPSNAPTDVPTSGPTFVPSDYPTANPTDSPSLIPTDGPSTPPPVQILVCTSDKYFRDALDRTCEYYLPYTVNNILQGCPSEDPVADGYTPGTTQVNGVVQASDLWQACCLSELDLLERHFPTKS